MNKDEKERNVINVKMLDVGLVFEVSNYH